MVGSHIFNYLEKEGFKNIIVRKHSELNLKNQRETNLFFKQEKPEYVINVAGRVGGIKANEKFQAQFLYDNLVIQNNIIDCCHQVGVKKLLFLGSSCIYPRDSIQPIKEESLLSGILEPTNEGYALAKIVGIKLCEKYNKQYGDNFIALMPTNLYGENDNFNLESSHVIPALIRRFHEAKINSSKSIKIWGSGKPLREFLHVEDLIKGIVHVLKYVNSKDIYSKGISHLNIGSGEEISIGDLAVLIKKIIKFDGKIIFDNNMPDGTPRKLLDSSIINEMGWSSSISLKKGITRLYSWYKKGGIRR